MNKVYPTWLSELTFEHVGYFLLLGFLGPEGLDKISDKTVRKPEAPGPERWHSPFPFWRLHGKPFCITCSLADGNPFCWPQSFQSSLGPVLPILSISFDSDCQGGASQDRCSIYNNIQQALFLWIPFGWQRGLMRMTELSVCLVTVSTGNNAGQLFIRIFGFSSPQKGASSELVWGGTVSIKILPSSLLVGPRGTST